MEDSLNTQKPADSPQQSTAPSSSINPTIQRILESGQTAVLITLVDASGEIATPVGTKLLLDESDQRLGTFGSASIDDAVVHAAREFSASRQEAGLLATSDFAPDASSWLKARFLFERIQAEPRILICGAGHVGGALAKLASFAGYVVSLIDDRAEFLADERFLEPRIDLIVAQSWPEAVLQSLGNGKGVAVAIVTRGHNEDEECLRAVMTTEPDYVGLIGSKRRTNIVLERLREAGFSDAKLKAVRAPIGLDIGAVTPEEVALAILAEMIAARRGGTGAPLSTWRRDGK